MAWEREYGTVSCSSVGEFMFASACGGLFATARVGCEARLGSRGIPFFFFFFSRGGGKKKQQKNLRSGATYDLRVAPADPFHPVTD